MDAAPTLGDKLQPSHTAIVVVDMQNDFFRIERDDSGGSVNRMYNGEALRAALPPLLEGARRAGVLLVFVRMINDLKYLSPPVAERLDRIGMLGVGCQSGTWGADYWEGTRPEPDPRRRRRGGQTPLQRLPRHRSGPAAALQRHPDRRLHRRGDKRLRGVDRREGLFNDFYGVMVQDCVADGDERATTPASASTSAPSARCVVLARPPQHLEPVAGRRRVRQLAESAPLTSARTRSASCRWCSPSWRVCCATQSTERSATTG